MTSVTSPDDRTRQARLRHRNAWILMAVVLALHVADEALTDFLSFYNPLVLRLRERLAWFPAPTFSFDVWIVGLALLVSVLFVLLPVIKRGGIAGYALSYALGVIMFFNGAAHLGVPGRARRLRRRADGWGWRGCELGRARGPELRGHARSDHPRP